MVNALIKLCLTRTNISNNCHTMYITFIYRREILYYIYLWCRTCSAKFEIIVNITILDYLSCTDMNYNTCCRTCSAKLEINSNRSILDSFSCTDSIYVITNHSWYSSWYNENLNLTNKLQLTIILPRNASIVAKSNSIRSHNKFG